MRVVIVRIALFAACAIVVTGVVVFGTDAPCSAFRAQVRSLGAKEGGFGGFLAQNLPDSVINAFLTAQYGELTPSRCVTLALSGLNQAPQAPMPHPAAVQPTYQQPAYAPPTPVVRPDPLNEASVLADAAIAQCRSKRLIGELRSYVASAQCSNPRIIEAYKRANYRYMDLIYLLTAKRLELSEKTDRGLITEAQGTFQLSQFQSSLVERARERDAGQR